MSPPLSPAAPPRPSSRARLSTRAARTSRFRRARRVFAVVAGLGLWCGAAPAAEAHPLGNFSVNEYTGLTLRPDRVDALRVTDTAEIPTLQAAPSLDTDGDGTADAGERAAWAANRCADAARTLDVSAPDRLSWRVTSARFAYAAGQGGLRTGRLECRMNAPLTIGTEPVRLNVRTGDDAKRVGWHEITAKGEGVRLRDSTAPRTSPSKELRDYPRDLLSTPRGDTSARLTAVAGAAADGASGAQAPAPSVGNGPAAQVEALSQRLLALTGTQDLTLTVGLLAVLLSLLLGAGHALLPGHGKTVMAAYLAGRRGSARDAVVVGATVTLTHTLGVVVLGLALTSFSWLAGDTVLAWLGVVSGALVALVGAMLVVEAVRRARAARAHAVAHVRAGLPAQPHEAASTPEALVPSGPPHEPTRTPATRGTDDHGHDHGHAHSHGHDHPHPHAHDHPHAHGHAHDHVHPHSHDHPHPHTPEKPHRHGLFGHHSHTHGPHSHTHDLPAAGQPFGLRGLIGLGVAGGLVPSPSALVVLLGAIGLGRTLFGASLVLVYGLGMAATLTAVGLLLVRLGERAQRIAERPAFALLRRLAPYTALLTATLVLVVGLGLIIRSLPPVL
ncbi:high frequency lysogenization protein HflD [Streptomyces sp. GZWMJZ-114]|uniref:nickel/cobalt transporter n=1 Tax=Streptomyces sp. GZWMJZ-114 TaxID=2494734 RepID=UPI001010C1D9|nr:high frequency lysogenization protein HflD [Streptomyces sp. GZWMJZ-114]